PLLPPKPPGGWLCTLPHKKRTGFSHIGSKGYRTCHDSSARLFPVNERRASIAMNTYDVCIVGAGGVGCAIARELAGRRGPRPLRIIVVEQHEDVGLETSSRNSGVLHSGIHERPGSLKAELAREGSVSAVAYAGLRNIPLLRCGMVIA